jgi:hypothetical protein
MKTPLLNLAGKAAKMGTATATFHVTREEARRIREAEARGGQQAGLATVIRILREKNQ